MSDSPKYPYPEHEKMRAIQGESQIIGNFLEAMRADGLTLCTFDEERSEMMPWSPPGKHTSFPNNILAYYFGIDQDKLEEEKEEMLRVLRGEEK